MKKLFLFLFLNVFWSAYSNGSMIKDLNKGISALTYNVLNLPRQMDIKSPVAEARNEYIYSANGEKLKVIQQWNPAHLLTPQIGTDINTDKLTLTKTIDYVGNKIYEDGALKMILTDNGYLDYVENKYYFYVRDHLGNNRVVTDLNLQSVQSTQYYPFGMAMGISLGQAKQPYKFGGKEFDMAFGVNMYDQVFRLFGSDDPTTPTPDPLAEKYPWMSPYAQMGLNPLRYVDPDGRDIYALTENERIVLALKTDDNFDRLWTFTTDKDGNIKSTATNVADQDFLPQLAANPNSTSYNATTSNKTDAFNVFKATSDASNFEWSLSGYKDKGSTKFYLNTQHSPGYAETGESNGVFEANNMLFNVHSHSQDDGAKGGSGYIYNYDFKTQMPYLKGYDSSGGSDGILAKYLYETTGKVMPLYVYHRGTQGLYKYTPWNYAAKSWLNVQSGTRMKSIIRP